MPGLGDVKTQRPRLNYLKDGVWCSKPRGRVGTGRTRGTGGPVDVDETYLTLQFGDGPHRKASRLPTVHTPLSGRGPDRCPPHKRHQ